MTCYERRKRDNAFIPPKEKYFLLHMAKVIWPMNKEEEIPFKKIISVSEQEKWSKWKDERKRRMRKRRIKEEWPYLLSSSHITKNINLKFLTISLSHHISTIISPPDVRNSSPENRLPFVFRFLSFFLSFF